MNSSKDVFHDSDYEKLIKFLGSLEPDSIQSVDQNNNNDNVQYCQEPTKTYEIDWSCMKLFELNDINYFWSHTFLLHTDWVAGIPEYKSLSRDDQAVLFKKNYAGFSWMTNAYKCYINDQARIGLPLGNGSYMPYSSYELERAYGIICRRIIDQVVIPMFEINLSFEEYCILKTMALFQLDIQLSQHATDVCMLVTKKLKSALFFLMRNMTSADQAKRMERMKYLISSLMDIRILEHKTITALNEEYPNR